jgi:hypothetical protein
MKISYKFYQHLVPQILSLVNTKNQSNAEKNKNHFPCCISKMDFIAFKTIRLYII